jgi:RNA polymerase primary sigma factor
MRTGVARRSAPELDGLSPYFRAIRSFPPLTREAEHLLALRARRGDASAGHALVRHNLGLVVSIARRQRRGSIRLDDLVQEGNVGLLRAAAKFDPHAGTRFSTYAVWWIRAFVGRYLKEARSAVRPRSGDVARDDLSLDAPVADEGETTHLELLEDPGRGAEAGYLAAENDGEVRTALARARQRIGPVGWEVVHHRLQEDEPRTLADLGIRWGVSRERVRQIEVRTRRFLHAYLAPVEP